MSANTDTPTIPERFHDVIVNRARYFAHMLRSDVQFSQLALRDYEAGLSRMRIELINKKDYESSLMADTSFLARLLSAWAVAWYWIKILSLHLVPLQLQNFEPDINGGYRASMDLLSLIVIRSGVPQAQFLGYIYKDQVIVAKGTSVFKSTGSGYTSIDTGRTSAEDTILKTSISTAQIR